ncbi:MAG: phosphoribosyltransferase [Chloroflexi bacterium]|nr:phosphoribosyltransferase [Chloroflexota bacterium]
MFEVARNDYPAPGRGTAGKVHVQSRAATPFRDRQEAGELLSLELSDYRGKRAVVLGIPRGGIVIARELARTLDADLDIMLSRKLRSPGHTELAMGSIAEDGAIFLNEGVIRELGVDQVYIQQEKERQLGEIARRCELIRRILPKVPLTGRIAILTDDGVATGATMQVALWSLRQESPRKLVVAVPVASEEAVNRLAGDADEVFCLRLPPFFFAVGQFYLRFNQVEDDDVLRILEEEKVRKRLA